MGVNVGPLHPLTNVCSWSSITTVNAPCAMLLGKHNKPIICHLFHYCINLSLPSVSTFYTGRQLSWTGHVARMKGERLPRKFISSWCNNRRTTGSPNYTYGRCLHKALIRAGISRKNRHRLALDKTLGRSKINSLLC